MFRRPLEVNVEISFEACAVHDQALDQRPDALGQLRDWHSVTRVSVIPGGAFATMSKRSDDVQAGAPTMSLELT